MVARELQGWEQHEQDLRRELAEAEERSRNPVIDESTLTAALGQQSAAVLRNAHDEAARITLQAEETAAVLLREAQQHASEVLVRAESGAAERIAEAEIAASSVHQQTRQEATALLEASRIEGEALVERAREQGRAMVEQAQEARRRVLADMAQRRRAITLQIEQFRAARDELAAAVLGVRDSVDRVVGDLVRADDDARAAAADVARRQPVGVAEGAVAAEVERAVVELDTSAGGIFDAEDAGPAVDRPYEQEPPNEGNRATEAPPAARPEGGDAAADAGESTTGDVATASPPSPMAGDMGAVDAPVEVDAVEDLFARLRASHPGDRLGQGDPAGDIAEGAATVPLGDEVVLVVEVEEEGAVEEGAVEEEDESPDEPALVRRGELLDPVVAKLARRLKRALQDDQNRLLDKLRSGSGEWSDDVLAAEEDQRALYIEAASANLRDAVMAGIAFARGELGSSKGRAPAPDDGAVAKVAAALAGNIVSLLRPPAERHRGSGGNRRGHRTCGRRLPGMAGRAHRAPGRRLRR